MDGAVLTLLALLALFTLSACGGFLATLAVTPQPPSAAATLQSDLSAIFGAPAFDRIIWSVLVRPVSSNADLFR